MVYYIVGVIAIIFLYKIFEERGSGWGFAFSLLLYIVLGFIFNKFIPMYEVGIVEFICSIVLIVFMLFIYSQLLYTLFNNINILSVYVVSAILCSIAFQYVMGIIYPELLRIVLNLVTSFI